MEEGKYCANVYFLEGVMEISLGDIIQSDAVKKILCHHYISTDFYTGPDPSYHRHDAYEIYLFIRGNTKMYVEQSCYQLSSGDCMVILPGQLHRCIVTDTDPYERIFINITEEALRILSSASTDLLARFHPCGENRIIRLSAYNMEQFIALTDEYLKISHSSEYGCDLRAVYLLTELILFTNRLFGDPKRRRYDNVMPELVSSTMKYVEEHLTEDISLTKLSHSLNYSSKYISVQFKAHTGLSLREYILDQRVECAKRLLTSGSSVSEACLCSGFSDYSNFIRSFKKKTGISPGRFRKEKIGTK